MLRLFLLVIVFSLHLNAIDLPKRIVVLKDTGILVRKSLDADSPMIGSVHSFYDYQVTDGKPTYVKIKTSSGFIGWAWVGENEERFEFLGNRVKSKVTYDIPVVMGEERDSVGPYEVVKLLDIWHSRLKVITPNNLHGWIYVGKYDAPWVQFKDKAVYKRHIYVNFKNRKILSNARTKKEKLRYFSEYQSYGFKFPKKSQFSFEYEVGQDINLGDQSNVLEIKHMIDHIDQVDAEVSIKVNDVFLLKNYRPSHNGFKVDSFHIGHLLQYGKNQVQIQLDQANTNYYIQSIEIKNT